MATIEITEDNFRDIYQDNEIVVLDFWASWCGPCQTYGPTFSAVSEKFPDIVFGKVDTEAQAKLAAYFEVRSIPTTIVIRQEMELFRQPGVLGEDPLADVVDQIQKADMDEVKKRIAEADAEGDDQPN